MNWINDLVEQHKEVESPRAFWFWAGLSVISAVVKDNVYLDRGGLYKLYPNIYCILHAKSGMKKGPPVNLAKTLVKLVNNTNIISGRSSIQGIMKKLGTARSSPGGRVNTKSTGFIVASELSASVVDDPAALTILTDLYDRNYNQDEWENLLKMESYSLKDATVSLLGGINDAHAEQFFQKKDINGGFLARTFVIYEKEEQTINSLSQRLTNPPVPEKLAIYLRELTKLEGKFKDFSDDENKLTQVGRYYDEWYHEFRKQLKLQEVEDDTGTLNRFGDSVLKVAILLSLAKEPKLEIDLESLQEAIEHCEKLIGNIRQTTMGRKGLASSAQLKTLIIREFLNRDIAQISREVLMKKMYLHYSGPNEFDELMGTFQSAGMVEIQSHGNVIMYVMPEKQLYELRQFFKGKMK